MPVICAGIEMYDPRTTIKVVAAEDIDLGESCYVHTDGLAYVVDNGKYDVCHGWALTAVSSGQEVTLVTEARMLVDTAQTIGARLYTGAVSGGSAPSTTLSATGVVVGFAIGSYKIFVMAPIPGADG